MKKTRVIIIDDQYMVRELFHLYIKSSERYEMVRMLASADRILEIINSEEAELVLMDILISETENGLDIARKIKSKNSEVKIIAITSMADASWLSIAKEIGIEGFWYKEAAKDDILFVMDRVMEGERVYPDEAPKIKLGLTDSTKFTKRELQVLRNMTKGLSNAAIAEKLNISENTVKVHIQHMMEKTGFENRTELAIEARISGMVVSLD